MGRTELYRERATECLAFAKTVLDPTWRTQLIAMAARWRELADRASESDLSNTGMCGSTPRSSTSQASISAEP